MKNMIRRTVISTLCAAAFVGVAATSAQAAAEWDIAGPDRTSLALAEADKPLVENQCRRADGQVVDTMTVATYDGKRFYALVKCRAKRA